MLPLIWVVGLAFGIAMIFVGGITGRDGSLWGGILTTLAFGVFMAVWLGLYTQSCGTVADLKAFSEVQSINYRAIVEESKEAIDWSEISNSRWYVQSTIFGKYASTLDGFIDKIYYYNQELARLRDFNENRWLDLIFKDVPPDLEYVLLRELPEGD